ncbi:unnamed protein product [Sphagnum jensenii]|uniref:DUF7748 domain-containing protein n=1 Tax=Sphagnum jensenii TaxID=128206 RepID=A0ABP1AM21_9BRYO
MVPTKIFNRTGVDGIRVREGNGDVINMWFDIPPKQFGRVVIEPNATYRRFRIAPSNLEINSDYCTDNKIVYVRMDDRDQKLFLDPVPRNSTMVRKTIINRTTQSVVLKEVIDAKEGEHDIATIELEQLESRKSHVLEMDPEGEHRKYFMKLIDDPREIEITEHLKTSKKSWEVTFDAAGNLSFSPASTFLLGSYMRGFG